MAVGACTTGAESSCLLGVPQGTVFDPNTPLPARIGEFVRVFVFARAHRLSKVSVLASVALERILDLIPQLKDVEDQGRRGRVRHAACP